MNNKLIKVNKKSKNILKKHNIIQNQKFLNKVNVKYKKNKSNNKISIRKKENKILKPNEINKKNFSIDIYKIKQGDNTSRNKNNFFKKQSNNLLVQNKKINYTQDNENDNKNKNIPIKKYKSMDKIKIKTQKNKKDSNIKVINNKKENNYKPINTLNNNKNKKLWGIKKKHSSSIENNILLKLERSKSLNRNIAKSKSINIDQNLKGIIENQLNINKINELIYKELDMINQNKEKIKQHQLKFEEIIKHIEKGKNFEKKLITNDYINKEKTKYKHIYNNISSNYEKINKLNEIKNEIDNKISNIFISIPLLLEVKKVLLNLKEKINNYFLLSKEIQNSQKITYYNLINEINYLKNSFDYVKNIKEQNENNKNNIKKEKKNNVNIYENNKYFDNEDEDKYNKLRENLLLNLDKEKLKKIVAESPKKDNSELKDLINYLKNKTNNLYIVEKAYVVFYWMAENIIYDKKSLKSEKNTDSSPEGIYKHGKTVCSGYSKLFAHIANMIGVETEYIKGYAKGYEYIPGKVIPQTNHEWNAIKINNNYYLLDSTWGSGMEEGDSHIKELDDFYFFCNPKYLIFSHFPENDKWQLLKNPITKDEFFNQVQLQSCFFKYHFTDISIKKSHFEVKQLQTLKLYYNTKNSNDIIDISVDVSFDKKTENESYVEEDNLYYIIKNEKNFEIKIIFNKKGNYKLCIYAKNQDMDEYESMIEYFVQCNEDSINELHFPKIYSNASNIEIIEPLYDNLKIGQEVKFKIKSDVLDEIIFIGEKNYYVKKNKDGFFEENVKVGKKCGICKKNENGQCVYLVKYNI